MFGPGKKPPNTTIEVDRRSGVSRKTQMLRSEAKGLGCNSSWVSCTTESCFEEREREAEIVSRQNTKFGQNYSYLFFGIKEKWFA